MKKFTKKALFFGLFIAASFQGYAQQFIPAMETFSGKKESFLVNTKGDTIKFLLDDLDRKKGLIVNVAGKTMDGKKFEYKAEEVKFLALAPSNYAKMASFGESTTSVKRMQQTNFKEMNRDLVFFYQEYLEDKERTVLVQLINPGFDNKIRVYDDPFAAETAGIGVGGMQVTGGLDKSCYVNFNGKTFKLKKTDYDKYFVEFFGSCPELKAKYKNGAWRDFAEHLFFFDQNCQVK